MAIVIRVDPKTTGVKNCAVVRVIPGYVWAFTQHYYVQSLFTARVYSGQLKVYMHAIIKERFQKFYSTVKRFL